MSVPEDLYRLTKIPDEDMQSGRHRGAQCSAVHGCRNPVAYSMTIEEWPFGEGNYNTQYYCEKHYEASATRTRPDAA